MSQINLVMPPFRQRMKRQRVHTQAALRQAWIAHWQREDRRARRWACCGACGPARPASALPPRLCGLVCGAITRKGPCLKTDISKSNGRCANHGGASTGPKSADGKRRTAANLGPYLGDWTLLWRHLDDFEKRTHGQAKTPPLT